MEFKELFQKHTLACLAGGFVIGVAVCGIGSPAFCGSCHAMKGEAATFAMSSHRALECTDCHLPHDNAVHYMFEKGRTGMIDTYHEVLRDYPANIKISSEGRQTVNDNCLRCHQTTMGSVHADVGVSMPQMPQQYRTWLEPSRRGDKS